MQRIQVQTSRTVLRFNQHSTFPFGLKNVLSQSLASEKCELGFLDELSYAIIYDRDNCQIVTKSTFCDGGHQIVLREVVMF